MPRMTDWAQVRDDGYAVPADRPVDELVAELTGMLRSPDPAGAGPAGVLDARHLDRPWGARPPRSCGPSATRWSPRFGDSEIQARTFAPLILDAIVSAGVFEASWVPPFERWYVAEEDLRGYDAKLGWLHAVAHGADLLGTLGLHPAVEPVQMLRLGIGRLLTPTQYVLRDMEDDRLGYALAATLTRDRPDRRRTPPSGSTRRCGRSATPPAEGITPEVTNTIRTLRALYLLVDHGPRPTGARTSPASHSATGEGEDHRGHPHGYAVLPLR